MLFYESFAKFLAYERGGNTQPNRKSFVRWLVGLGMWRCPKLAVITAVYIVSSPAKLWIVAIHST